MFDEIEHANHHMCRRIAVYTVSSAEEDLEFWAKLFPKWSVWFAYWAEKHPSSWYSSIHVWIQFKVSENVISPKIDCTSWHRLGLCVSFPTSSKSNFVTVISKGCRCYSVSSHAWLAFFGLPYFIRLSASQRFQRISVNVRELLNTRNVIALLFWRITLLWWGQA